MVLGVKVWALAHLLANNTLADLLLFGSFLVWAVLTSARRGRVTAPPARRALRVRARARRSRSWSAPWPGRHLPSSRTGP